MNFTIRREGDTTRTVSCENPEVILGKQGDVVLEDKAVSRKHAVVTRDGDRVMVRDLGSTNGTRIQGNVLTEAAALGPLDEIEIGPFFIRVELDASTSPLAESAEVPAAQQTMTPPPEPAATPSAPEPVAPPAVAAEANPSLGRYGPLAPLLSDDKVSEIMVNGPDEIFIERAGMIEQSSIRFPSADVLDELIRMIAADVGRRVEDRRPMVDCRLPDGSRVNAVMRPLALRGPYLTIRRFPRNRPTAATLLELGSLSLPMLEFLRVAVAGKMNILIAGGTGAGKTTVLNVIGGFIGANERIVTIEDAAELRLPQRHVLPLEARPPDAEGNGEVSIRELLRNSLRMRPDRIVVGEVRSGEALDMLQAMNTGHEGSLGTIHANSPREALSRLETLVLFAGTDLPPRAIREQIVQAIRLVIQVSRTEGGKRRVVAISELSGMEGERYTTGDIFVYENSPDRGEGFHATGYVPRCRDILADRGQPIDSAWFRS